MEYSGVVAKEKPPETSWIKKGRLFNLYSSCKFFIISLMSSISFPVISAILFAGSGLLVTNNKTSTIVFHLFRGIGSSFSLIFYFPFDKILSHRNFGFVDNLPFPDRLAVTKLKK